MTALNKQALRSKSRAASAGEWIKESGDGWEAICSSDDQANGNFIIAHFEGPDAEANREFSQAANPDTVLALLDALEAAETCIAELSASNSKLRDTMAGIHNTIRIDGGYTPLAAILNAAKRAHEESAIAAGIGVKGERLGGACE
ncbi:ead/Ea22-like family protein [Citrobacter sp. Igbk 17]|uniref:ead/Ea22-like family protein n=1 Tax=Citrobacter sp. Igbk 17 TaxID=2963957 RepID=UPI00230464B2|nr:ead/Ea22-like family protein [Citrobacter sp. Igbk 17]MDA8500704.1 ead/Ea22-like family protein [Citrobacter sp. Igbk 17]